MFVHVRVQYTNTLVFWIVIKYYVCNMDVYINVFQILILFLFSTDGAVDALSGVNASTSTVIESYETSSTLLPLLSAGSSSYFATISTAYVLCNAFGHSVMKIIVIW